MNTKSVKKSEVATIVAKAMKLLASAFSEPYEHTDRQTGEVSIRNSKSFWQDGVLGGVCFQLASKLEYTKATTMPRAKDAVQAAIRAHKGDELSEVALQRAVEWLQRLMVQEAEGEAAYAEAKAAYHVALGKPFGYRGRESANRDIVETPAMAAARAMGIGATNVAAGFGSHEPIATQRIERLPDATGKVKAGAAKQAAQRSRKAKGLSEIAKLLEAGE